MQNSAMLDIANNGLDTIIFKPEEMLWILDLRSLGYLQNPIGHIAMKFEQVLQIWKGRHLM